MTPQKDVAHVRLDTGDGQQSLTRTVPAGQGVEELRSLVREVARLTGTPETDRGRSAPRGAAEAAQTVLNRVRHELPRDVVDTVAEVRRLRSLAAIGEHLLVEWDLDVRHWIEHVRVANGLGEFAALVREVRALSTAKGAMELRVLLDLPSDEPVDGVLAKAAAALTASRQLARDPRHAALLSLAPEEVERLHEDRALAESVRGELDLPPTATSHNVIFALKIRRFQGESAARDDSWVLEKELGLPPGASVNQMLAAIRELAIRAEHPWKAWLALDPSVDSPFMMDMIDEGNPARKMPRFTVRKSGPGIFQVWGQGKRLLSADSEIEALRAVARYELNFRAGALVDRQIVLPQDGFRFRGKRCAALRRVDALGEENDPLFAEGAPRVWRLVDERGAFGKIVDLPSVAFYDASDEVRHMVRQRRSLLGGYKDVMVVSRFGDDLEPLVFESIEAARNCAAELNERGRLKAKSAD